MQPLAFKMLLHKKGTASAIIAVALLVALLAAVDCLVNNINSQTTLLTKLANSSDTYLIVSETASSLSDSKVDFSLVSKIRNISNVKSAVFLRLTQATIERDSESFEVGVVGVDDLKSYLRVHGAYVNGSIGKNSSQVNVGVVLANLAAIEKNSRLNVTIEGKTNDFSVVGTVQVSEQSDTQLLLPLETLWAIQKNNASGYIEFVIADVNQAGATLHNISQVVPSDTRIVGTKQVAMFASDINSQTIQFLIVWSVAVYAVVAAASYIITARVVSEAEYELNLLGVLGAKKSFRCSLVLVYALFLVFIGSVLGVSLGIVGTQFASTVVRWVWGSIFLAPFLESNQEFTILLLSSAAALLGSLAPAYRAGYRIVEGGQF